jgi:gamma-tubulin complex component 3
VLVWKHNNAPDKAIRFTNVYSRFLTLPILTNKFGMLQLLDLLSNIENPDSPRNETPPHTPKESSVRDRPQPTTQDPQGRSNVKDAPSTRLNQRPNQGREIRPDGDSRKAESDQIRSQREPDRMAISNTVQVDEPSPNTPADQPSDMALLRDLPFTLQGLSSENLPFTSATELALPVGLSLPIVSLLHTLAEPSLLYRSLSEFVNSREEGLVGQSLRAAINIELRSYLGLIATLEGEIRRALISMDPRKGPASTKGVGVSLKRCVVWTRDATMGLRLMSLMAEESKSRSEIRNTQLPLLTTIGKKGGQLISLIHSFSTSYGDPFVSAFAERMLAHLTRPFYDMLRQWIYDGELADPYHEFFVIERDEDNETREMDPRRVPAASVWEDKYKLDKDLVPSIITDEFANKIFLIGKSLNFIRYSCGDSGWVEEYSKDASKELSYGDTAGLETSIDQAYKTTKARLVHLMGDRFRLFEHMQALKNYLLLGQGDFVELLMESLASNLDRPAGSQYRHTLTAQLEHAIRGSNAYYDSNEVLRRLDARLLELSHGDIGWDVFTLEYKIDAPVDVVITAWASKQYLVIFNFLWRIKRVEYAMSMTWRRFMTGARGVLRSVDDKLGSDWKAARCAVAEMIHFINQLQYYILFEVIEASWDDLQAAIRKPECTLDDLISAHTKYLKAITHKGLLGSTRSPITGLREDGFMAQLHQLLKIMLSYKDAVDGLYSFSVAEFTRQQELHARIETRTAAGTWGRTEKDDIEGDFNSPLPGPGDRLRSKLEQQHGGESGRDSPLLGAGSALAAQNDEQMLPALRKRLHELSADFRVRLATLLGDLMVQPDGDLKFLGVAMNFNDVYRPTRRKRDRRDKDKERRTPAPGTARTDTRADVRTESRMDGRAEGN